MGRSVWNKFKKPFVTAAHSIVQEVAHPSHSADYYIPFNHPSNVPLVPKFVNKTIDTLNPVYSTIEIGKTVIEKAGLKDPEKRKTTGKTLEKAGGTCAMVATATGQVELMGVCAGVEIAGIALDASGKAHEAIKKGDYAGALKEVSLSVGKMTGKLGSILDDEDKEVLKLDKIGSISQKIADNTDKGDKLLRKLLKIEEQELKEEEEDRKDRNIVDKSHNDMLMAAIGNTKTQIEHDIQQDQVMNNELQAQQKNIEKEEAIIQSQQESITTLINTLQQQEQNLKEEEDTVSNLVANAVSQRGGGGQKSNTGNEALDFILNNFQRFENLPKKQKTKIIDKLLDSGALDKFL